MTNPYLPDLPSDGTKSPESRIRSLENALADAWNLNASHILQIEQRRKTIEDQETKLKKLQDALVNAWTKKAESEDEKNNALEELRLLREATKTAYRALGNVVKLVEQREKEESEKAEAGNGA